MRNKTSGMFLLTGVQVYGDTGSKKVTLGRGKKVLYVGFIPHGERLYIDFTGNPVEIPKGTRLKVTIDSKEKKYGRN